MPWLHTFLYIAMTLRTIADWHVYIDMCEIVHLHVYIGMRDRHEQQETPLQQEIRTANLS